MYLTRNLSKSPYYQVLYKNSSGNFTTKSTNKKRKSDALKFLQEFRNNREINDYKKQISLREFADEYLEFAKSIRSDSYIRSIKSSFNKLNIFCGDRDLLDLDHRLLEQFIISIYSKHKFASAHYYRTLKAAFEKARFWGYMEKNPLKNFKLPTLPKSLPIFISRNELSKIIEVTDSEMMKVIFQTAFFTGLRLGELLNLKWTSVDLKRSIITVANSENFYTKNKRERIVPISNSLNSILTNYLREIRDENNTTFVFTKCSGVKLRNDFVSKTFKKSVRKAGLNARVHFHTLRHSFASCLVQRGVSLYVIKELLGHQDIATTQIYAHIKNENLIEAIKSLDLD